MGSVKWVCRHRLWTRRRRGRVKSPRFVHTDGPFKILYIIRTCFYFQPIINILIFITIYLSTQASTGGTVEKLLNSQIITSVLPPSRPLIAPSEANPDDAIPSNVTSFDLDKSWLVVSLANSSVKVFSTHWRPG